MKTIRIIFIVFIMMACTKENNDYKSVGTITGIDGTMCGCCGGWIIYIEDVRYLIDSMPENSSLNLAVETFPITVKLDWQLVNNGCSVFNRITVQRIKKI
jgi:hypothetical protein